MFRVSKWLEKGTHSPNASTTSFDAATEIADLNQALKAAEKIMNDDIEGAEQQLAQGDSIFHKLGRGVLGFIKSVLGFEHDIMKEASEQLYEAETGAGQAQAKAQHDARAFHSEIYERGAEFALCQAEAQIMAAVVAVLNENLTESLKGFYKVRKAYMTLDGLVQMETAFMKSRGVKSLANSRQQSRESLRLITPGINAATPAEPTTPVTPVTPVRPAQPSILRKEASASDSDDEDEFYDADTTKEFGETQAYTGRLSQPASPETLESRMDALAVEPPASPPLRPSNAIRKHTEQLLEENIDSEIFLNPLDEFIHSGINMCFGMLLLMISMIPPAFAKLLYVIGFHGDRIQGLKMLWQASKFPNVNGAIAAAVLFGWYGVTAGFCDIVPDMNPDDPEDVEGYPDERLHRMLTVLKDRYPKSQLWVIEQARMASAARNLDKGLEVLSAPHKCQLKQLEALHAFEQSLTSMFAHRYKLCADSFLICVDMNAWSQAMYYYTAGAAHLEAYRQGKEGDGAEHKKLAEEYFRTAPTKVGKKKMLGRQLPFDTFVLRKIAKWDARAAARKCSFVDAIGVSPMHEMIYLWNGYRKMDQANLEECLRCLDWSEQQPGWAQEETDERGLIALLRAVVLRNLRRHDEARELLQSKILAQETAAFQGHHRDDYIPPSAHYEMGANFWMQRNDYLRQPKRGSVAIQGDLISGVPDQDLAHDRKLIQQCKQHVEKAKNWGRYELEARMGIKIATAIDALKKWEAKHSGSA